LTAEQEASPVSTPKNVPTDDEVALRRVQVGALTLARYSQREIARRLSVSVGTVNADLKAIRAEWVERRLASYEQWVEEELAVLDKLQRSLLPLALQGNHAAADRVLSVMDRRARLVGLDRPQEHRHTVITMDAVEAEIERLEQQLGRVDAETPKGP